MKVPHCSATPDELAHQRRRQERLAPGLLGIKGSGSELVVSFAEGFDRAALDQMIEVERRCCPFFGFEFDERALQLTVSVSEPDKRPALEAIASALQPSG